MSVTQLLTLLALISPPTVLPMSICARIQFTENLCNNNAVLLAMEHPQVADHALTQTLIVPTGLEMVSAPALSIHLTKRDNIVVDHATSVEKIPQDDRPNDHPFPIA